MESVLDDLIQYTEMNGLPELQCELRNVRLRVSEHLHERSHHALKLSRCVAVPPDAVMLDRKT